MVRGVCLLLGEGFFFFLLPHCSVSTVEAMRTLAVSCFSIVDNGKLPAKLTGLRQLPAFQRFYGCATRSGGGARVQSETDFALEPGGEERKTQVKQDSATTVGKAARRYNGTSSLKSQILIGGCGDGVKVNLSR